jgi:hypothetical protein
MSSSERFATAAGTYEWPTHGVLLGHRLSNAAICSSAICPSELLVRLTGRCDRGRRGLLPLPATNLSHLPRPGSTHGLPASPEAQVKDSTASSSPTCNIDAPVLQLVMASGAQALPCCREVGAAAAGSVAAW